MGDQVILAVRTAKETRITDTPNNSNERERMNMNKRDILLNSPLSLHPEILEEVLKYVYLPKDVVDAYKNMVKPIT